MNPNIERVPFSRPVLGPEEEAAVLDVMRSGWLTTGSVCAAFEAEFAAFCQVPWALAVNSATAGLHLALEALGVGPGDLCAVPDYTFTATAEVVRYLGADVVLVDCEPQSPQMDMEKLEEVLKTRRIKVVLPVHLFGQSVNWSALAALKERYGFFIVEDAAHTFPARNAFGLMGTLGDIGVYSFYANKNITTGEGGMVVTRNADWAQRMRVMRLHGIDRDAFARFTSAKASWEYRIVAPGFKYNMTDLAAAIGRVQLTKAQSFWDQRRRLAEAYIRALSGWDEVTLPVPEANHGWHVFSLLLSRDRDQAARRLQDEGVGISVHYIPLHRMPYWADRYHLVPNDFPQAEVRGLQTLSLPLFPSMSQAQQDFVVEKVFKIWGEMGYHHP